MQLQKPRVDKCLDLVTHPERTPDGDYPNYYEVMGKNLKPALDKLRDMFDDPDKFTIEIFNLDSDGAFKDTVKGIEFAIFRHEGKKKEIIGCMEYWSRKEYKKVLEDLRDLIS